MTTSRTYLDWNATAPLRPEAREAQRMLAAKGNGAEGIDFDENGTGNLTAAVANSSASNNTARGVRADAQVSGADVLSSSSLTLTNATLANNDYIPSSGSVTIPAKAS